MKIIVNDCVEAMREMEENSIDAIVTDPPYAIGFMSKQWDVVGSKEDGPMRVVNWFQNWAREALRVLKPGGYLLVFGGSRTYHSMAMGVELAGFEIRDQIQWVYGQGFPKSMNVGKAIDKKANEIPVFDAIRTHLRNWRDVRGMTNSDLNDAVGSSRSGCGMARHWTSEDGSQHSIPSKEQWAKLRDILQWDHCEFDGMYDAVKDGAARPVVGKYDADMGGLGGQRLGQAGGDITAPATDAAKQWDGWGTALKPAHEPIVMARKPFKGSVASNVLEHGTSALNIDRSRVAREADKGCPVHGLRRLRNQDAEVGIPGSPSQAADDVRNGVPIPGDVGGEQPTLVGRNMDGQEDRVQNRGGPDAVGEGQKAASETTPSGVPGASTGGRQEPQSSAASGGARPPHQRDEGGQPALEPRSDGLVGTLEGAPSPGAGAGASSQGEQGTPECTCEDGRWPANLIHDGSDDVAAALGDKTRLFYCAKPSKAEKNAGLGDEFETKQTMGGGGTNHEELGGKFGSIKAPQKNSHPTVKPVALMAYLCRLVTPPGGTVLDPFLGSGTTGVAAVREGFDFIGIEREAEYAAIAEARVEHERTVE